MAKTIESNDAFDSLDSKRSEKLDILVQKDIEKAFEETIVRVMDFVASFVGNETTTEKESISRSEREPITSFADVLQRLSSVFSDQTAALSALKPKQSDIDREQAKPRERSAVTPVKKEEPAEVKTPDENKEEKTVDDADDEPTPPTKEAVEIDPRLAVDLENFRIRFMSAFSLTEVDAMSKELDDIEQRLSGDKAREAVAAMRTSLSVRRKLIAAANEAYDKAVKKFEWRINAQEMSIARVKKDIEYQSNYPMNYVLGYMDGLEETLAAEERSLLDVRRAYESMNRVGGGNELYDPKQRMAIVAYNVRQGLKRTDFSEAARLLEEARDNADAADKMIRDIAEELPGGKLGIALGDTMIDPNDPDLDKKYFDAGVDTLLTLTRAKAPKSVGNAIDAAERSADLLS